MLDENWQRWLLWMGFIIFLASLLLRQETAINQDLGRHLRLGETIVKNDPPGTRHQALATNFLTYTYPDYPFVNHHWASQVVFYLMHRLGDFSLLVLFKGLVLGLTWVVVVLHSSKIESDPDKVEDPRRSREKLKVEKKVIAVAITFFSIQMMATRLVTRPEIFGYLLFSVLFWLLDSRFSQQSLFFVLCSLLIALWVNLHLSFVFGLVLIWLWAISKKLVLLPLFSTLATLLNPHGIRGALMPLSILKDYGYTIVENMTPFFLRAFRPQPEYLIYAVLLSITIILSILSKKRNLFHLLVLIPFSILPLLQVRQLPFFALVIPVVLAPVLATLLKGLSFLPQKDSPYQNSAAWILVGGLLMVAFTNPVPLAYAKLPQSALGVDQRHFPAVQFIKENDFQGKMWNNYDIGSFLEWALPDQPTFVDGRPEAFPVEFFTDVYQPMQESQEAWDKYVEEYQIQWVFAALTDATPWFRSWWQLIQQHEGWRVVYLDEGTVVLVRRNGINGKIEPVGRAKTREIYKPIR